MAKLNTARLRTLTKPGVYGDGDGLYLQVRDANRRTWIYRYTLNGKARWMGLGSFADVSLAEAREAAADARKQLRQGRDPIEARRAQTAQAGASASKTFADVTDAYIAAHEPSWRNPKHRQQWRNTLTTYVLPIIGKMPVAMIETEHVMQVLEPIWRTKPETASRVRGRIEAVLDYAKARGWRTAENSARWRGHMANLLPRTSKLARVQHHAALPWQQISSFVTAVLKQDGVAALALRFEILTVARTDEVLRARWREIDMSAGLWIVPATRMKAAREHRVPLSMGATEVLSNALTLRTTNDPDEFVFPGAKSDKPLSSMAMLMLLRRMGRGDLTVHGFRSTFRDWCAEDASYAGDLAEMALAHTLRDKTEAAYRRGDMLQKRRQMMEDWAAFCGCGPDGQMGSGIEDAVTQQSEFPAARRALVS
jgi:integrase